MSDEKERLLKIWEDNGICSICGLPWEHHMDEPFASCGCGTSEWYNFDTPFMKLQKEIQELQEELDKANTLLEKVYESGIKLDELEEPVHKYLVGNVDYADRRE